jgi:hypothetical protein
VGRRNRGGQPAYVEMVSNDGIGYQSAPVNTHPRDQYVDVPWISPPFDVAYSGAQKVNAITSLAESSVWVGMPPLAPSQGSTYTPYTRPVFQGTVSGGGQGGQRTNIALAQAGPGVSWMPNPTEPNAQYPAQTLQPSLWASIRGRLGF